jgi:hypothetical protein
MNPSKLIKIVLTSFFILLMGYLVSCNVNDTPVGTNKSELKSAKDNNCTATNCPILAYCCNNYCFTHHCLFLKDAQTGEGVSLLNVARVTVSNGGNDCENHSYSCSYELTNPSNPTASGCYLPSNTSVVITRSVCGTMKDGRNFRGSITFHPNYEGSVVPITYGNNFNCTYSGSD